MKSGVSRGRSGERSARRGTGGGGSKPDFSGFLDSIGVEDGEDDDGSVSGRGGGSVVESLGTGGGVGRAPY